MPAGDAQVPVRQVAVFLAIAFSISWMIFGALHLAGGFSGAGAFATLYLFGGMFGPAIAALACTFLFDRRRIMHVTGLAVPRPIRLLQWLPYAWLVPSLLAILAAAIVAALQGGPADASARLAQAVEATGQSLPMPAETLLFLQLAVGLPVGFIINTLALTLSEELGWRGWLQPKLAPLGFWQLSLLIGVIWGLWHAPIILMGFNYPGLGWGGVAAMVVFCVLLTPYLSLLRERMTGSWGPGAFHGAINAITGATLIFVPEPVWPMNGLLGIPGFAVLLAGWPLIALYRLRRPAGI